MCGDLQHEKTEIVYCKCLFLCVRLSDVHIKILEKGFAKLLLPAFGNENGKKAAQK